ncbi:MAG: hypothetical protein ABW022_11080 [Actinoplanes sp.]
MAAGNHTLGTIRGTIEIDYDGAGVVKAVRDTDKAKKSIEGIGDASDKVLGAFAKFGGGAVKVAGAVGLVSNSVNLLAATLAVAGPLLAATFAAAPAVILGYVSAMAVLKIAVSGVSDALGAAAEGGKKFDEAMKKLSPQAQAFVRAYQKAIPVLDGVKKSIQDAFFRGTAGMVGGVVRNVASLRGEATALSGTLGDIVKDIVSFVTSGSRLGNIRTILQGTNSFLQQIGPALAPLVAAFIRLAAEAAKFGDVAGGSVVGALTSIVDWMDQIDVAAVFEKAGPILSALGIFLGNVAIIAGELFSIFNVDGANAAGILGELAGKLAQFLQSAEGQAALQALGQAMSAIAGAAGQVFLALLQALAPTIVALAPGVGQLATQLASVLVPALNAAAPILAAIAQYLSENMSWLGPLAGAVVAAAAAYKAYAAAAKAVGVAQDFMKKKLVQSTLEWIRNTAASVANRVAVIASAIATGTQAVAAWIANTAVVVANRVAVMASTVATNVARVATIAWTATTYALGAAMRFAMGPIGLIITAIGLITAAIIYLWNNNEGFRNAVIAAWNWIKNAAQSLWNALKAAFSGIVNSIRSAMNTSRAILQAVWAAIVNIVRNYINTYRAIIVGVINFIKSAWTAWLNNIRNVTSAVWSAIVGVVRAAINNVRNHINTVRNIIAVIRTAFTNAKNAAVQQLNNLLSAVRRIPGQVTSALGNLGRLLYNKGRDLIRGFIDGIGSMIGAVKNKVSSVVGSVTRFLPGSPAKEGPLSGRGYVLLRARRFMADFARGLEDGRNKPTAALLGGITPMVRATVPSTSTTSSGASTARTTQPATGAAQRVYRVAIGDKEFAELVVDAVTGAPVAVSKAVSEGSRRTAWAGSGRN